MWTNFCLVGLGAALGAWGRWLLGLAMNGMMPVLPMGTLIANLLGGYLIGVLFGAIQLGINISPEMKLLIATGFLGGLTTFSTFSAEAIDLLLKGEWGLGLMHVSLHLFGSLLFTLLGIYSARTLLA